MVNVTTTNFTGDSSDYVGTYISGQLNELALFGVDWLPNLILTGLILIIITRDYSKWRYLALPANVLVNIAFFPGNYLIMIFFGLLFAFSIFGKFLLGEAVKVVNKKKKDKYRQIIPKRSSGPKYHKWSPKIQQMEGEVKQHTSGLSTGQMDYVLDRIRRK